MKTNTYVTFVEWEHEGTTYKRVQEQYNLNAVLTYVNNLDLTKRKAVTHIYNNNELTDIVDWNMHIGLNLK